ncbi:hypothetical protein WOLCODRAFT_146522 [Wolfiporia cocos MD-104 SS10]|uniref:Uncharacterized protein n=1 Tax=Wolfiporia cocos (strain MD-104) TaxID=742152 RepID=A0A2H3J4E6_WOLCO|nr:hypothetical protein WOLCODRAFT_146522 [Wolfiporia cocos MD-104 SS10]
MLATCPVCFDTFSSAGSMKVPVVRKDCDCVNGLVLHQQLCPVGRCSGQKMDWEHIQSVHFTFDQDSSPGELLQRCYSELRNEAERLQIQHAELKKLCDEIEGTVVDQRGQIGTQQGNLCRIQGFVSNSQGDNSKLRLECDEELKQVERLRERIWEEAGRVLVLPISPNNVLFPS